jgi:hypothetical protein
MKKVGYILFGLLAAGVAQGALITAIDGLSGVADWSGADFSGQSVSTAIDNWGRSDNFTGADFSDATFTFSGNQSFLATTITDADFTGATFDITTYLSGTIQRFNTFRNATGSGASFVDTTWNITLSSTDAFDNSEFFAGTGTLSAMDFSGATFTFDITDSDAATQLAAVSVIINNLGDSASYFDTDFVNNNFDAFGYADADALETDLLTEGWVAIPEPATISMLGLGALVTLMVRRNRRG